MSSGLWRWPTAAHVDTLVSKDRLVRASRGGTTAAREALRDQVESVVWAYKLAPKTVALRATSAVPEFQVFEVLAKTGGVADSTLELIDRAIPTPVLFEVREAGADGCAFAAALQSGTGPSTRHSSLFRRPVAGQEPAPLPGATNLAGLYLRLLAPLLPVDIRPGENDVQLAARLEGFQQFDREARSLSAKMGREVQFKKKIELRRDLHEAERRREEMR